MMNEKTPVQPVLQTAAVQYAYAELCVIPCQVNGSKKPLFAWKEFETIRPSPELVEQWFSSPSEKAIAMVCGPVSGGLECLDFDAKGELFEPWKVAVEAIEPGLVARLAIERSPSGGFHVLFRSSSPGRSVKLAARAIERPDGAEFEYLGKTLKPRRLPNGTWAGVLGLIETKGTGGYFLCAPSKGYEVIQGDLAAPPNISNDERDVLIECAAGLNEFAAPDPEPEPSSTEPATAKGARPGDQFNSAPDSAASVAELLAEAGWRCTQKGSDRSQWRRPGKKDGISATLWSNGTFHVFSSNAAPFDEGGSYSPFQVLGLLKHGGDWGATAKALAGEGYGQEREERTVSQFIAKPPVPVAEPVPMPMPKAGDDEALDAFVLRDFNADEDSTSVLGNRWLCEGGGGVIIGQSGAGKSSLVAQLAMTWILGRDAWGIRPRGKLRILMIQAENDLGDIAEQFQGVAGEFEDSDEDVWAAMKERLFIVREAALTGKAFCERAHKLILKYKPDLVIADPLLSYIGGEISKQEVCSSFLRNTLNPILFETRVAWLWVHHTNKPLKEIPKNWTDLDLAYMGGGSADLTNWARLIAYLCREQGEEPYFQLNLPKRGRRAGMLDGEGKYTTKLSLKHASSRIAWQRADRIEEPEAPRIMGPKQATEAKEKASKQKQRVENVLEVMRKEAKPMIRQRIIELLMGLGESKSNAKRDFKALEPYLIQNELTKEYSVKDDDEEPI